MDVDNRLFDVEGFGQVGAANLWAFVPLPGEKPWQELQVSESTIGYASGCGEGKRVPERVTRIA